MKWIIAGGTGFIGEHLVRYFSNKGVEFAILGRDVNHVQKVFGNSVHALTWQGLTAGGEDLLQQYSLIINLAGANIGAKPWSEARREELLESRIQTAKLLSDLCASLGKDSPALFNASAVGIYPLQQNLQEGAMDEATVIDFNSYPTFSAEITRKWESQTFVARDKGVRVVNMRFAVVLGSNGGALQKMVLPFKLGLGGVIGSGEQPFPWVHITDLMRAVEFLWEHKSLEGPVNIVSPGSVNQREFAKVLGTVLKRPTFLKTPAWALKLPLGQMAEELLLQGSQVYPKKLLEAGFSFKFPDIQTAFKDLYGDESHLQES